MTEKRISDYLSQEEILAQMAEEAAELAQAALKLRRALDGTNPTPKSVEECMADFAEEFADISLCVEVFLDGHEATKDAFYLCVNEIMAAKRFRWLMRLQEAQHEDPV